jgi:hypothetical protein
MWNAPKNNGKYIAKNGEIEKFPRHDLFKKGKT